MNNKNYSGVKYLNGTRPSDRSCFCFFKKIFLFYLISTSVFALEKINLQLKWHHQFQFAGFYAAKELGFYKDAGLDVTLSPVNTNKNPISQVLDGSAQYGVGSNDLLLLRDQKKPVVVLAVIFQHSPYVLLAMHRNDINTVHDLVGKTVLIDPYAKEILAYLKASGVPLEQINLVESNDYNSHDLVSGKADAYAGYSTNDPFYLDQLNADYLTFTPRSIGIDFYGDNIFTTESEIEKNPNRVKRFISASLKGWEYVIKHPDDVIELMIERGYYPASERDKLKYESKHVLNLINADLIPLGTIHEGRWRFIRDTFAEFGMINPNFSLNGFIYGAEKEVIPNWVIIIWFLSAILIVFVMVVLFNHRKLLAQKNINEKQLKSLIDDVQESANNIAKAYSLLHATLEASDNGIIVIDLDGSIIHRNTRFLEMWRITEELIDSFDNERITAFITEKLSYPEEFLLKLKELGKNPSLYSQEVISLKDGRYFRRTSKPEILDRKIVGRVWSFLDVTDQYIYEQNEIQLTISLREALHKSEREHRLLSSLLYAIPDLVWATDLDGVFLVCNPAFGDLLGVKSTEIIGKTAYDFFPKAVADKFRADDITVLNTPKPISIQEWVTYNTDGHRCLLETIKSRIPGEDGKTLGALGIARDITQLQELMNDLAKARTEALKASEAKSLFLANMSHEIRTPMNAILGMTELCLNTSLNERQINYLNNIQHASESLLRIINDILDFSKIEAGKLAMESTTFVLESVFDQVSSVLALTASKQGIELSYDIDDESQVFRGDPMRLAQVLINLVGNAIKFSVGGSVLVTVKPLITDSNEMELLFAIRDEGIGMSPDQVENLFKPFSQADASTTRRFGGTGLGLTIASRLVEMMGGRIWVESTLDIGSTFYFTVKLEIIEKDHRFNFELLANDADKPILVIDDCRVTLAIMQHIITKLGLHAQCVSNPKQAIEMVSNSDSEYLACFIDLRMPEMDGCQVVAQLRTCFSQKAHTLIPPMILVTQHCHNDDLFSLLPQFDGFLAKPVTLGHFFHELARSLGMLSSVTPKIDQKAMTQLAWSRFRELDILLVEDIDVNQQVVLELLGLVGLINVRLATNGVEAIDEVSKKRPDLILMDCQMPVMDGYEATVRLRQMYSPDELPIIALTASALESDIEKCQAVGMNAHCSKPISMNELYEKILLCLPNTQCLNLNPSASFSNLEQPELPRLQGIDARIGLVNVGGRLSLYLQVLKQFRDNQGQYFESQFKQAYHELNWRELKRLAHSLKGVSYTLGANDLGESSALLLDAIEEKALDDTLDRFAQVVSTLNYVIAGLAMIENLIEVPLSASNSPKQLQSSLEQLLNMLKARDTAAIDLVHALAYNFNEEPMLQIWKQLHIAIDRYDFKAAIKEVEKLIDLAMLNQN